MKVLQINATYGIGSTGFITRDISRILLRNGIESYVAYSKGYGRLDNNASFFEIGSWLDHKIHAILCRIAGKQAYFSRIATKKLLRFIKNIHPDIVHLHNLHSNYINLNMLLEFLANENINTVVTMHDCWYFTGGCFHYTADNCSKWQSTCGGCVKKMADTPAYIFDSSTKILNDRSKYFSLINNLTFVGVSDWVSSQLKLSVLRTFANVECIHNGFDLQAFQPYDDDFKNKLGYNNKFLILGPASKWLLPINRQTLDYFANNLPPNAILILFGHSGGKISLPNNVHLYGFTMNREEMAQLYSMADVMVNCSREDTLSSLNLEAQACGTPVITYEATGSKETVDGISSFSVSTGDFEELFYRTMEVYKNGKSAYSDSCRSYILQNFEKDACYAKYISLYKRMISSHLICDKVRK